MADFPPSPGLPAGPGNGPTAYVTPPPRSAAAIIGLIASLVICVPFLTQLVGLVCGFIGLFSTSGGQRRGRGWAITAICVSLVVAALWTGVSVVGGRLALSSVEINKQVTGLLKADEGKWADGITELHASLLSERLKLQADEADTAEFLRQVRNTYGRLEDAELLPDEPVTQIGPDQLRLNLQGRFAEGSADIQILMGLPSSMVFEIDNISVGDVFLHSEP